MTHEFDVETWRCHGPTDANFEDEYDLMYRGVCSCGWKGAFREKHVRCIEDLGCHSYQLYGLT